MKTQDILKEALNLNPNERSILVDGILRSLDEPDTSIDTIWHEEIEKRVKALHDGRVQTIPYKGLDS